MLNNLFKKDRINENTAKQIKLFDTVLSVAKENLEDDVLFLVSPSENREYLYFHNEFSNYANDRAYVDYSIFDTHNGIERVAGYIKDRLLNNLNKRKFIVIFSKNRNEIDEMLKVIYRDNIAITYYVI